MQIELTETDALFVRHVLRMYAKTTEGMSSFDREEILDLSNKFNYHVCPNGKTGSIIETEYGKQCNNCKEFM